jgi:hypothetical protein
MYPAYLMLLICPVLAPTLGIKISVFDPGVVANTCNPTALELE